MPGRNHFEFFRTYFPCVKPQTDWKLREIGKPREKNKIFAAIFVFLLFLISISIARHTNYSKIQKSKKFKRDLRTEYNDYEITQKNDVEIVPENRQTNPQYPNHRYGDDPPETESKFWPSERMGAKTHPNNIKDIILKSKRTDQSGKFENEILKVSGSSMRLKGVYKQSGTKDGSLGTQNPYSKEINNLMQNNFPSGGKRLVKHAFRTRGAPFRLPVKGETRKRQKPNFRGEHKLNHPITIYLDFYPMKPEEVETKNLKPGLTPQDKNLIGKESINVGKFVSPSGKQKGIVMKLNLYPKGRPQFKRGFGKPVGGSLSKYNERAERKSFGWFSKHKKEEKRPKECTFPGLNPRKNHITAKWKNEKGEWIHADHVDVKYFKKDSNKS